MVMTEGRTAGAGAAQAASTAKRARAVSFSEWGIMRSDVSRPRPLRSSEEERQRIAFKLLLRELVITLVLQEVVGHVRLAWDVASSASLLRQSGNHVVQLVHDLESALGQDRSQESPDSVALESTQSPSEVHAVEQCPDEQVRLALL